MLDWFLGWLLGCRACERCKEAKSRRLFNTTKDGVYKKWCCACISAFAAGVAKGEANAEVKVVKQEVKAGVNPGVKAEEEKEAKKLKGKKKNQSKAKKKAKTKVEKKKARKKVCARCKKNLYKKLFREDKSSLDGRHSYCIKCEKEYSHERYLIRKAVAAEKGIALQEIDKPELEDGDTALVEDKPERGAPLRLIPPTPPGVRNAGRGNIIKEVPGPIDFRQGRNG